MSRDQVTPDQHDENKLIAERRAKLDAIRAERNPFPNDFSRTAEAAHLQAEYGASAKEVLEAADKHYSVAGRLIRNRTDHGAVLILDKRVVEKSYGRTFLNSLPPCRIVRGDSDEVFSEFQHFFTSFRHLRRMSS